MILGDTLAAISALTKLGLQMSQPPFVSMQFEALFHKNIYIYIYNYLFKQVQTQIYNSSNK
jgi:hypothetical protein